MSFLTSVMTHSILLQEGIKRGWSSDWFTALWSVGCVQKLASDLKLLEQENELLKQKVDAGKARYMNSSLLWDLLCQPFFHLFCKCCGHHVLQPPVLWCCWLGNIKKFCVKTQNLFGCRRQWWWWWWWYHVCMCVPCFLASRQLHLWL